jgi:hypothetical protein
MNTASPRTVLWLQRRVRNYARRTARYTANQVACVRSNQEHPCIPTCDRELLSARLLRRNVLDGKNRLLRGTTQSVRRIYLCSAIRRYANSVGSSLDIQVRANHCWLCHSTRSSLAATTHQRPSFREARCSFGGEQFHGTKQIFIVTALSALSTVAFGHTYERCDADGDHCVRVTCDHDGDRCWSQSEYSKKEIYTHPGRWVCDSD